MIKTVLISAIILSLIGAARSQTTSDYRWSFETGTGGVSLASIKEKNGYIFSISCASAGDKTMAISLYSPSKPIGGKADLQVVIDDENFPFELSKGSVQIGGHMAVNQLLRIIEMLQKTKSKSFLVELPATSMSLSFSTLGAPKYTAGILDGCIENPALKRPVAATIVPPQNNSVAEKTEGPMYIGRWYSGNARVCKGRKGETEGLLTYTLDEMAGLENFCRIVRKTAKGAGVELTMRCSGEGTTSTDREIVEVVDGRLRRTVLVEGKSATFTYSRCP